MVVGNWKMHGHLAMLSTFLPRFGVHASSGLSAVQVVVCPPFTLVAHAADQLAATPVALGAQDCHAQDYGPYTGDISASQLKEAGCSYVIVGHSERRLIHAETDAMVLAKAEAALRQKLVPIICVGETLDVRQKGHAEAFVVQQIQNCLPQGPGDVVIAYEPVWAIGTGLTPSADDIISMHARLHIAICEGLAEGARAHLLYGGSVKAANAKEILDLPGVDGVLVGGASIDADQFCAIIDAASCAS